MANIIAVRTFLTIKQILRTIIRTRIVDWDELQSDFAAMEAASESFDEIRLEHFIKKLVPEMTESLAVDNVIHFDQIKNLEQ